MTHSAEWSHAGRARVAMAVCVVVAGLAGARPAASETCYGMSPGVDGVLRLDTGRGEAWPCNPRSMRAYRAHNALPEAFEMKAARTKSEIKNDGKSDTKNDIKGNIKNGPVQAKADGNPAVDDRRADDGELLRLKGEAVRLRDEMARLKDEASRLRRETARLKDQLALRDATESFKAEVGKTEVGKTEVAKTDVAKTDVAKTEVAKTEAQTQISKSAAAKGDGKILEPKILEPLPQSDAKRAALEPTAPKGDLLTAEPQSSEVHKSPPEKKTEAQLPDEQAFERQKGVVERAWKQLIDLAARMKGDVSGKP